MWTPGFRLKRAARAGLGLALCLLVACGPDYEEIEPPLRTLVYTETPGYDPERAVELEEHLLEVFEISGQIPTEMESKAIAAAPGAAVDGTPEELLDALVPAPKEGDDKGDDKGDDEAGEAAREALHIRSPEALAEAIFKALTTQEAETYERLLIGAPGLMALAKIKEKTARKRARSLRRSASGAYRIFAPGNKSEEPEGGLATKVALVEIKIGKAGTIWGKAPTETDEVVQHWGNYLTFKLKNTEATAETEGLFTMSLGRMLKTPNGEWRLASAPEVSSGFRAYLAAGFHLKPELLQPEHHPFPLSVGNFWRYRIERPSAEAPSEEGDEVEPEEIRIEVMDVEKYEGYRLVGLRRLHKRRGKTRTEKFRYLVTARRLYTCSSYCRYKIKDMAYILSYSRQQTPHYIFPLLPDTSWTIAGALTTKKGRYRVRERTEQVAVPAGEFSDTLVIVGKRGGGQITRYFKPGVGVVQRLIRGTRDTRVEELVEYRILTAE